MSFQIPIGAAPGFHGNHGVPGGLMRPASGPHVAVSAQPASFSHATQHGAPATMQGPMPSFGAHRAFSPDPRGTPAAPFLNAPMTVNLASARSAGPLVPASRGGQDTHRVQLGTPQATPMHSYRPVLSGTQTPGFASRPSMTPSVPMPGTMPRTGFETPMSPQLDTSSSVGTLSVPVPAGGSSLGSVYVSSCMPQFSNRGVMRFFSDASTALPESPSSSRGGSRIGDDSPSRAMYRHMLKSSRSQGSDTFVTLQPVYDESSSAWVLSETNQTFDEHEQMECELIPHPERLRKADALKSHSARSRIRRSRSVPPAAPSAQQLMDDAVRASGLDHGRYIAAIERGKGAARDSATLAEEKRLLTQAQQSTRSWLQKTVASQITYVEKMEKRAQALRMKEERAHEILQEQRAQSAESVAATIKFNNEHRLSCFVRAQEKVERRQNSLVEKLIKKDEEFTARHEQARVERLASIAENAELRTARGKKVYSNCQELELAFKQAAAQFVVIKDARRREIDRQVQAMRAERRSLQAAALELLDFPLVMSLLV
eukprot:TRINITY_DN21428_c0_g5_i2.p1 TRINITY_DN21428_c0_g5~~TRINITY_DN21428_c0_g5_i2.p1  ORF type:complete len:544 (-),score=76.45 TRINITY_DN21428_c0_g5_i2:413-2044(-)